MPNLSIMLKPASSLCNLNCQYCFYHSLAKDRAFENFGMMSVDTAHALIDSALELADKGSIYFAFQGGEPLLRGIDFYKDFVEYTNTKNAGKSAIFFTLQTNGTLITKDWAQFFHQHNFLIGLSLDGDQNANKFRLDKDGDDTFSKVIEGLFLLEDYEVDFNILSVATGYTAKNIKEIYSYFKYMGVKHLQFIPCLKPFGDTTEDERYMTVEEYRDFLMGLFSLYATDAINGRFVSIRYFDNIINMVNGIQPEQCGLMGHCNHQFVIEGNGNVYPCDFYCTDEWLLGNINDTPLKMLAKGEKANAFLKESLVLPDKCKDCKYLKICHAGGCKRNRESMDYCEAYKVFFEKTLPLIFKFFKKAND